MRSLVRIGSLALALAATPAVTWAADAQHFINPTGWSIGDADSTHQGWDLMQEPPDNTPDDGYYNVNGTITVLPTLTPLFPGLFSSSGNIYGGDFINDPPIFTSYPIEAVIYNHGGTFGNGPTSAELNLGTHVIIQTATTLNDSVGVLLDSLAIVDLDGNAILGGGNAEALQASRIAFSSLALEGGGPVGPGAQKQEERIWEFYLPNYTGDFMIVADIKGHVSFTQLQVDTMLTPTPFAISAVPEPATLGLLVAASGFVLLRRSRHQSARQRG